MPAAAIDNSTWLRYAGRGSKGQTGRRFPGCRTGKRARPPGLRHCCTQPVDKNLNASPRPDYRWQTLPTPTPFPVLPTCPGGTRKRAPVADTSSELATVWARIVERLGNDQGVGHKDAQWLQRTHTMGLMVDTALLAAPNEYAKGVLEGRLLPAITELLSHEYGRPDADRRDRGRRRRPGRPRSRPRSRPRRPTSSSPAAPRLHPRAGSGAGPRSRAGRARGTTATSAAPRPLPPTSRSRTPRSPIPSSRTAAATTERRRPAPVVPGWSGWSRRLRLPRRLPRPLAAGPAGPGGRVAAGRSPPPSRNSARGSSAARRSPSARPFPQDDRDRDRDREGDPSPPPTTSCRPSVPSRSCRRFRSCPSASVPAPGPAGCSCRARTSPAARLNPKYLFETFVIGSSNRFAHAAAVAVAEAPAKAYNPLFIYGESGLAQTGLPVDEQRVVRLGGGLGHRHRGGVGEAVAGADDEGLEQELGVRRADWLSLRGSWAPLDPAPRALPLGRLRGSSYSCASGRTAGSWSWAGRCSPSRSRSRSSCG